MLSPLNVMNRFTLEQRQDLFEIYFIFTYKDNCSEVARNCYIKFDRRKGSKEYDIRKLIAKVHETGFIGDTPRRGRDRTVHPKLQLNKIPFS